MSVFELSIVVSHMTLLGRAVSCALCRNYFHREHLTNVVLSSIRNMSRMRIRCRHSFPARFESTAL